MRKHVSDSACGLEYDSELHMRVKFLNLCCELFLNELKIVRNERKIVKINKIEEGEGGGHLTVYEC